MNALRDIQRCSVRQRKTITVDSDLVAEVIAGSLHQSISPTVAYYTDRVTWVCRCNRLVDFGKGVANGTQLSAGARA